MNHRPRNEQINTFWGHGSIFNICEVVKAILLGKTNALKLFCWCSHIRFDWTGNLNKIDFIPRGSCFLTKFPSVWKGSCQTCVNSAKDTPTQKKHMGLQKPYAEAKHMITLAHTSSTAQGCGGNFKSKQPIGEVGCYEPRMAEQIH